MTLDPAYGRVSLGSAPGDNKEVAAIPSGLAVFLYPRTRPPVEDGATAMAFRRTCEKPV
jgi:hypothetical protein